MDINTLRSAVTLLSFLLFIAIVAWAWSRRQARDFDEAAQLPFTDDVAQLPFVDDAAQLPLADEAKLALKTGSKP